MEIPASLATMAFDGILKRGDIIHFKCGLDDGDGKRVYRNKFAVILNASLPEDPVLCALATSQVAFYNSTTQWDNNIIRIPAGTYSFLPKDTVISFRAIRAESLDELRKQYASKELTIVGKLSMVHVDHANRIIENSVLIEGWKQKRCTPPSESGARIVAD
jgi:hypothetical protein